MFDSEAQYVGSVVFAACYWGLTMVAALDVGSAWAAVFILVGVASSWASAYAGHAYSETDHFGWSVAAIFTLSVSVALAIAAGWTVIVGLPL